MAKSYTYDDESLKESLWDVMTNIDPVETHVSTNSGTVEVSQIRHEWPNDTLTAQTSQEGVAEGADTTYAVTNPTRAANYTQIIEKGFEVTDTQKNSDQAGYSDRFAGEQKKKMKEWKNQLEWSAVRGSLATGDGSTARQMQGLQNFASTLATAPSGVSLSETMFNDYLGDAWDQGSEPDTVLVGRVLKRRISGFTAGSTRNIEAKKAELVGRVDVYDSDFGRVKVVKHRYVQESGDTDNNLLAYQSDMVKIGFLDKPHFEERAKIGYSSRGAIVGEATVQVGHEKGVVSIERLK